MNNKKFPYIVDERITPINAKDKGYKYVQDVIDPYTAVKEIIELAQREGYTFGAPTNKNGKIGLYKKE